MIFHRLNDYQSSVKLERTRIWRISNYIYRMMFLKSKLCKSTWWCASCIRYWRITCKLQSFNNFYHKFQILWKDRLMFWLVDIKETLFSKNSHISDCKERSFSIFFQNIISTQGGHWFFYFFSKRKWEKPLLIINFFVRKQQKFSQNQKARWAKQR